MNPTTGKYSVKPYECESCGREEEHGTNHWSRIYPYCKTCGTITQWVCCEPKPEGYDYAPDWAIRRLGEICDVRILEE